MQNKAAPSLLTFLLLAYLTSCTPLTPVSIPIDSPTLTQLPVAVTAPPTATSSPLPTATRVPAMARAKYTLNTVMDYDAHTVVVDETILYPNQTAAALDALVLAVEPNLWDGSFNLQSISVDGAPLTTYALEGQKLNISLTSAFRPETVLTIHVQYTLALPFAAQADPNISRPRIYGYTKRQLNLTNWYPFVVPNINGEWVLHDPGYFGEHLVYDAADYEVNLTFADPSAAVAIAASGSAEQLADSTRYTITAARSFAMSASRDFHVASLMLGDVTVTSYYFDFYQAPGQAVLQSSAEALQLYSQRFGAYPHQTLSIVMGDFNDGMEYSGFFFMPLSAYNLFDGTKENLLTTVAVHETAHQWWFEQVGNDQAVQPWLDESLATYTEIIYYETYSPQSLAWWWQYWPGRLQQNYTPQGRIDIPITGGESFVKYTGEVYLNGAHFLQDLRARIGDQAFFAFLQDYLAQENGRIATSADFFRILREHTSADLSDLMTQYFKNSY